MATKEEHSSYVKRTRESMEKKGQVNFVFDIGLTIKLAIKEGKLFCKMDKQYASINKFSVTPGFNFSEINIKETYIKTDKTDTLKDTGVEDEGKYILKSVNDALSRIPVAKRPGIFLAAGYYDAPSLSRSEYNKLAFNSEARDTREENKSSLNNNVHLEESKIYEAITSSSTPSGTASTGSSTGGSSLEGADLVGKIILYNNIFCVVASYNDANEVYDMVQICKKEGTESYSFFIKKIVNVPKDNVNEVEDETDKFISLLVNSETKPQIYGKIAIYENIEKNKTFVRKICKNVVSSFVIKCVDDFDSITNVTAESARKSSDIDDLDDNSDIFETDDIYQGSNPEDYIWIFKYKKPSYIEIRMDSLSIEKILEKDSFIDTESDGYRITRITSEDIAKYARTAKESNGVRIFINTLEVRPNECYYFLVNICPDILIQTKRQETGFKNDAKKFLNRWDNASIRPWSEENTKEANKRPYNNFFKRK